MRAHELDLDGTILNTIEVEALDALPGKIIVDAIIGGGIGDKVIDGVVIPRPTPQPTIEEMRVAIQTQIDEMERGSIMNRGVRETMLRLYEDRAPAIAAERGITVEQVLAEVPAYVKFKALDDEIKVLRDQYNSLG